MERNKTTKKEIRNKNESSKTYGTLANPIQAKTGQGKAKRGPSISHNCWYHHSRSQGKARQGKACDGRRMSKTEDDNAQVWWKGKKSSESSPTHDRAHTTPANGCLVPSCSPFVWPFPWPPSSALPPFLAAELDTA